MKAISRLLIMFTLMMCMTGFSSTTTDLSQNSELECVINPMVDAVSVNVVSADVLHVNYFMALDSAIIINPVSTRVDFIKPLKHVVDDVGWQLIHTYIANQGYKSNKEFQLKKEYNRNPRDGITYISE